MIIMCVNLLSGSVYDLSTLKTTSKSTPYSVTDKQGHKYEFNICGPVYNSACSGMSASMGKVGRMT